MKLLDEQGNITPAGFYAGFVWKYGFLKGTLYWFLTLLGILAFALINGLIAWWFVFEGGRETFNAFIRSL